jgi:hypothetical protein
MCGVHSIRLALVDGLPILENSLGKSKGQDLRLHVEYLQPKYPKSRLGAVVCTYSLSTQEAEAGGSLESRSWTELGNIVRLSQEIQNPKFSEYRYDVTSGKFHTMKLQFLQKII